MENLGQSVELRRSGARKVGHGESDRCPITRLSAVIYSRVVQPDEIAFGSGFYLRQRVTLPLIHYDIDT